MTRTGKARGIIKTARVITVVNTKDKVRLIIAIIIPTMPLIGLLLILIFILGSHFAFTFNTVGIFPFISLSAFVDLFLSVSLFISERLEFPFPVESWYFDDW